MLVRNYIDQVLMFNISNNNISNTTNLQEVPQPLNEPLIGMKTKRPYVNSSNR